MEIIPFRDFGHYPLLIWGILLLFAGLFIDAVIHLRKPWSKPALAIYVTIFLWYPGNFIYVGTEFFRYRFSDEIIRLACWQIIFFLCTFRFLLPYLADLMKVKRLPKGHAPPPLHEQLAPLLFMVTGVWLVLFITGCIQLEEDIMGVIWPLSTPYKVDLFVHSGVGGGWDFLTALAQYVYQLCAVFFGVAAVLSRGWLRALAIALVLFTWPYFMFGRVRNIQLSLLAPAIIAYLLFVKSRPGVKICIALLSFLAVHIWFLMVIDYRADHSIERFKTYFVNHKGQALTGFHYGLEMMEELCHMNTFIDNGKMQVTYGKDYLDEALNFVPRTLWTNKPRLGYDYLMARGMSSTEVRGQEMTVYATIATGVIGQGILNFGKLLGPIGAAFIVAMWAAYLSKLWQERWQLGKAFLMLLGLGLTFNMGRGFSLLVFWPFVFGVILMWFYDKLVSVKPIRYSRLSSQQRAAK